MILVKIVSTSSTCMDVDPGVLAHNFAYKEKFMKAQHIYTPSFYYREGTTHFSAATAIASINTSQVSHQH